MNKMTNEEIEERRNRPKMPIVKGESCNIVFQPCCYKMESALADGDITLHLQKTIFNKDNVAISNRIRRPSLRSKEGLPINQCPFCRAEINICKDVEKMITCYGVGITKDNEETIKL